MKHFIFIKPVTHVQIGHIYEHIYCHQLTQFFREKGLFAFVDYSVDGKTYYDGYVRIEVILYSSEALALENAIDTFTPVLDDDVINGAIIQIMAEKQADIQFIDIDVVRTSLQRILNSSWQPIEDLEVVNTKTLHKTHKGLRFIDVPSRNFMYLTQKIELNAQSAGLDFEIFAPLFVVVANAIRQNLQEIIATTSFCYSVDEKFNQTKQVLSDSNRYRIDKRQATALSTEIEYTKQLLDDITRNGFVERLSEYLQTAESGVQFGLPDDNEISKKIHRVVGQAGWRAIGTEDNITKILQHISISFTLGSSKRAA